MIIQPLHPSQWEEYPHHSWDESGKGDKETNFECRYARNQPDNNANGYLKTRKPSMEGLCGWLGDEEAWATNAVWYSPTNAVWYGPTNAVR